LDEGLIKTILEHEKEHRESLIFLFVILLYVATAEKNIFYIHSHEDTIPTVAKKETEIG